MSDTHKAAIVTAPTATVERMHPLVSAAMASGALADPATMRELLAVQREWEAGEARKSYSRALAALKRDLPTVIRKDATVDYNSAKGRTFYRHASLAGVMDAITEPLTAHGFSLAWIPSTGERGGVRVTCRLTHQDGHHEECSLEAAADTSGSKSAPQAIASTITLLSRYTALALLGIATADMPEDGAAAQDATPKDAIDADRNMRAMRWLADRKVTREAAEAHVGRPISAWTADDLARLRAFGEEASRADAHTRGEDPDA
jgi:hypothetical protein